VFKHNFNKPLRNATEGNPKVERGSKRHPGKRFAAKAAARRIELNDVVILIRHPPKRHLLLPPV